MQKKKSTKNGSSGRGEPRRYTHQQEQFGGNFPPENSIQFSYNSEQLQMSPQTLRSIPEEGRHTSSTRHNNGSQQRVNSTNPRLHRQQSHPDSVFNRSNSHRSLNRNRSMVRPERHRPRPTMINNSQTHGLYRDNSQSTNRGTDTGPGIAQNLDQGLLGRNLSKSSAKDYARKDGKTGDDGLFKNFSFWPLFARVVTFWAPSFIISACGLKDPPVQQAWREKVTLCLIILFFCFLLGVFTFGLRPALCPDSTNSDRQAYSIQLTNNALSKVFRKDVLVHGVIYRFDYMRYYLSTLKINLSNDFQSTDLSQLFDNTNGHCAIYDQAFGFNQSCQVDAPFGGPPLRAADGKCLSFAQLAYNIPSSGSLAYEWFDFEPNNINPKPELIVFNNNVINMTSYLNLGRPYFPASVHNAIITALNKDGTLLLNSRKYFNLAMNCIGRRYAAGVLSTQTIGCMATNIIMIVSLGIILIVIMTRFIMAIVFSWFMSRKLTKVTKSKLGLQVQGKPLYTVMLVTCYSEGEVGLRTTLDSLTTTNYSDKHKLFFIIADGMIKGEGNDRFTPDICLSLIDLPDIPEPESRSYIAIADGEKQLNLAKVYAGHYSQGSHRVPVILIVKVGNRMEKKLPKPGNRGKRDSQMIMMNFFQRVFWDDRFTELDYEIFWKIHYLMGITADRFELVLMVDADTKVAPNSLTYMVSAMKTDSKIMGLCGETRIANKTASWVSMIQVFEYYVSHHLGKSFESVFGGVTCLPGCFCMYRLKVQKGTVWIPLLCALDVVSEYQQNVVTTLHQKNLLLLGEDRFLSTLMLRSFPKRKMMFVPEAMCHTIVPDSFNVLLSQRRRWINSTVHNLLELTLVSELCGIGCLSMQAMIILDLIGTIVLPIAVCLTFFLIIMTIISNSPQTIPLLLLAAVLGLPGVLIILTTRKIIYVFWMFVYLLALPIWNFVLPVYAYWHFDDFSWGETRKVLGDADGDDHGKKKGVFDSSMLVMRRWEEWERERRCMSNGLQLAKSEKRGKNSKTSTTAKGIGKKAGKQISKHHQSRHPKSPESTPAPNFSLKPSEQESDQRSYPYSTPSFNSSRTLLQPPQGSQTNLLSSSSSNESLNNGVSLPPHDNYNYWPAALHGNSQNTTPSPPPPPAAAQSPYQSYSYILPQGQSDLQNTTLSPPPPLPYEQLSYQNYNYMGVPQPPQGQHNNMTNTAGPDGSRHIPTQFPPSKRNY